MKTRYQKVICILACVFLIASFFVVPVSAATVSASTFTLPLPEYEDDDLFFRVGVSNLTSFQSGDQIWNNLKPPTLIEYIGSDSNPSGITYSFNNPMQGIKSGNICFWLGQSSYNLSKYGPTDIFWIDPGSFTLEVPANSSIQLLRYRFSLRIIESDGSVGRVVAKTKSVKQSIVDGSTTLINTVEYPKLDFTFDNAVTGLGLLLCLDVAYDTQYSSLSTYKVSIYKDTFTVHASDGPDPNLPQYSEPDQGSIGEVDDLESDILDGSQDGLDSVSGQLDSSSLTEAVTDFQWAFVHISRFMTRLSGNIPYLDAVIYISISLGLLATLVALSGAIVTASDRRGKGSKVKSSKNKKE